MKLATLLLLAAALVAGHDGRDNDGRDNDDRDWNHHNPPPVAAPEPATYAMMALGLGAIVVISQRRKK